MIYLLVGYMWLFIHRPFEIWPGLANLHIERVYMLITIGYWAAFAPKVWTANRVNVGVALLISSIVISTLVSPHTGFESEVVQDWFKIVVFYVLMMSAVKNEEDLRILVISFVGITGFYELHSLREFLCGRGTYTMGTWRMVGVDNSLGDPNSFAASVNYAIPMLLPLACLATNRWQRLALIGLLGLGVTSILLTGSRTGFAALTCLGIGVAFVSRYRWKIMPVVAIVALIVWGQLSEELQNRYLTLINPSRGPANAQASAESRKHFFKIGVKIWEANPVFGVGPAAFSQASGTGMESHSLYAQVLSELGTFGACAILTLIAAIFANFVGGRTLYWAMPRSVSSQFCYYVLLGTAIAVLQLLFLGFGGHNLFRFTWLWYGAFSALANRFLKQHYREQSESVEQECEFVPGHVVVDDDADMFALAVRDSR